MVLGFLNVIEAILEFLILRIETEKILKTYTYIQFFREHSSAFNTRFSIFSFQSNGMY